MRIFANLFLILFVADGSVSLLDELVSLLIRVSPVSGLRNVLATTVILMAVPVYLGLGIDRRLPKRVFLPLILFLFLCPLSAWLFPSLDGNRAYGLLTSAAQVALGTLPFSRFGWPAARTLTMPPAMFAAPWFSLRNTLVFGGANLVVIPLALALFVLSAANAYLADYTAGFMRIAPGGVYMSERVYRRGNRTIRLAAMIHVGDKEYYDGIMGAVAPGRTIVLAEGVTDDRKLLRTRPDYGKVASFLGLTSQVDMQFRGRTIEPEALDAPPAASGEKEPAADILRADLDVSAFRPPTILLLNAIGKYTEESRSLVKGFLALNAWAEENLTPEMNDVIMDDILHRRNREVLRYLGKALDRYDTVVIPWGALHMKGIEEEVLKRGFVLQEKRERVSIDFRKMLPGTKNAGERTAGAVSS